MTSMTPQSTTGQPVDPSHLMTLGKDAARLSKTAGISLTNAVVHTVGMEKLNSEQVRRVVEFTNIEAFNDKFASMDAEHHRFVDIDNGPADPAQVLQSLSSEQQVKGAAGALEYSMPPIKLANQQHYSDSGVFRTRTGVLGEVLSLQHKLASSLEDVVGRAESASFCMEQALESLEGHLKRAEIGGALLSEVFGEWARLDEPLAKVAFAKLRGSIPEAVKVAGRRIDPSHEVMSCFDTFVKSAHAYHTYVGARQRLEAEMVRVGSWLETNGD